MISDRQLARIYGEGNVTSHATGLRLVYEAGEAGDEFLAEPDELAKREKARTDGARREQEKQEAAFERASREKSSAAGEEKNEGTGE